MFGFVTTFPATNKVCTDYFLGVFRNVEVGIVYSPKRSSDSYCSHLLSLEPTAAPAFSGPLCSSVPLN